MEKVANSRPGPKLDGNHCSAQNFWEPLQCFLQTETPTLRLKIAVVEAHVPGFSTEDSDVKKT